MEANTPATLHTQTRKRRLGESQTWTGCWKEKNLFLMPEKEPILQSLRLTVVYSVHQQSSQSAPPESLTMKWQKWCPHGLAYLIPLTANPTGIMGSYTWDKAVRTWSWQSHPVLRVSMKLCHGELFQHSEPHHHYASERLTSWNLRFYSSDCND